MMKLTQTTSARLFISLVLLISFSSCNQPIKPINDSENKYEQFFLELHKRGQFNGNALIFEKGEIAFQGSFGIRSINPIDSLDINSVFRLGSISKTFTAAAIMILKEQGKLNFDQDIRDFIPDIPYNVLTIRHLLNHTSGLPDYPNLMDTYWKPEMDFENPAKAVSGNEDAIKMLIEKKPPLHFKPIEKWEYSNTGYMLLATIVSRASQIPFESFLDQHIFKPAGMSSTSVYKYVDGNDENMPNRVFGFNEGLAGKYTSTDYHYLNNTKGDGGVYSTLGDLLKWDRILHTNKILSEEIINEAFTTATLNNGKQTPYGFGWFVEKSLTGQKVVQHSGGWVGFLTFFHREIEENNCIILLTNNNSSYFNIISEITNIMHNKPHKLPKIKGMYKVGNIAMKYGADSAITFYKVLKNDSSEYYEFDERQINVIGYDLLSANKSNDAVKFFKLNVDENTKSANAFDSYGDGLLELGDTLNALINFKKTVELDSTFWIAIEKINRLEESQ